MLPRECYSLHEIECRPWQGAEVVVTLLLKQMDFAKADFCTTR